MTRDTASIDRETLVAFIDNELPPVRAAEVERALATDPEAQEIVRLMRIGGTAAAHAFDQALEEPPPAHVLVTLHGGGMPAKSEIRRVPRFRRQLAFAACLASLAIGFAGGYFERGVDGGYAPASAKAEDPLSASFESALFVALASGAPGRAYDYGNDAAGHGHLVLGRQFVAGFGSDCREFDRLETRGSVQSHDGGIACQNAGGGWTVMTVPR